jgi:hypothetical protein
MGSLKFLSSLYIDTNFVLFHFHKNKLLTTQLSTAELIKKKIMKAPFLHRVNAAPL